MSCPRGTCCWWRRPPACAILSLGPSRAASALHVADDPAGLARYSDLRDVHVYRARTPQAPWARAVVRDAAGPLLIAGEPGPGAWHGGRVAVLGFDLHDSDLPLNVSFPVLIGNLLDWLAPGLRVDAAAYGPGQTVSLGVAGGARSLVVTMPDGARRTLLGAGEAGGGGIPFADTAVPGIYTATERLGAGQVQVRFAVNLQPASGDAAGPASVSVTGTSSRAAGFARQAAARASLSS